MADTNHPKSAEKKSGGKGAPRKAKFGAKADFIRSKPATMPARQVVDEAAKEGMKLTINHVYAVRSQAKSAVTRRGPGRPRKGSALAPAPARGGARGGRPQGDLEEQLRRAIAELGLSRARHVFDQVEAAFSGR